MKPSPDRVHSLNRATMAVTLLFWLALTGPVQAAEDEEAAEAPK